MRRPKSTVKAYSKWMLRGIDVADQMRGTYTSEVRSKKWWHRLFYFLVDTTLTLSDFHVSYVEWTGAFNVITMGCIFAVNIGALVIQDCGRNCLWTTGHYRHARFRDMEAGVARVQVGTVMPSCSCDHSG